MKIVFLFLLCSFNLNTWASIETKEFDAESVKKLEISNPKGDIIISVQTHNPKKIIVTLEKIDFAKSCRFNVSSGTGILGVKIEQENAIFEKANCISKLKVEVPNKNFDIDVSSGTAPIKIIDTIGPINFKTATGFIEIKGDSLKNIDGKSATGNLRLSYNKCLSRADIDFVTATGNAEIYLPSTCKIKVSHKSATGELFNELGESEDSLVLINAKSATGSLKIKKLNK